MKSLCLVCVRVGVRKRVGVVATWVVTVFGPREGACLNRQRCVTGGSGREVCVRVCSESVLEVCGEGFYMCG